MKTLTSIGEQTVTVGTRSVKFRPSLLNMTRIGTPREIVETYAAVMSQLGTTGVPWIDAPRIRAWTREQFAAACVVMWSCTDEDISWLVGYVNENYRYVHGALPLQDIVALAMGLLRHGIMGDVSAKDMRAAKGDYVSEFKARDVVSAAMAHLGASEEEAWQMTMTSFLGAMRAKYPPQKDAKQPPTEAEYDHVKAWLTRVNSARAKAANHG